MSDIGEKAMGKTDVDSTLRELVFYWGMKTTSKKAYEYKMLKYD